MNSPNWRSCFTLPWPSDGQHSHSSLEHLDESDGGKEYMMVPADGIEDGCVPDVNIFILKHVVMLA